MVAVYPSATKKFAYRQDFTNIVDAADVNVLYDEVTAVENVLGTNPNWDNIDGKVNKWSTVGARISAVREGVSNPYVNVQSHNFVVPFQVSQTFQTITWTSKTWDTHSMWTGGPYVTCPRTGVYTFDCYIRWHSDALSADNQQTPYNRSGKLSTIIRVANGSADLVHDDRFYPAGWQAGTHMSSSITLPWTKGQQAYMVCAQSTLTTGITATANMCITYHRDGPTLNNL